MTPSPEFYSLLIKFEGLKLKAYRDSAGIPTIGIGTIIYPDGKHVKIGDTCTKEQAYEWAEYEANQKAKTLNGLLINTPVTPQQFDALLSLVYNIGSGAFAASTLLKRVKSGKGDIREAFLMWRKAKNPKTGVKEDVKGLITRRNKEADLYLL